MRVDKYWLRIGVAYHAETGIAFERVELVFKFCAEIASFDAVYASVEAPLAVESHHAGTLGAEV